MLNNLTGLRKRDALLAPAKAECSLIHVTDPLGVSDLGRIVNTKEDGTKQNK